MRTLILIVAITLTVNLGAQNNKMVERAKSYAGYVAKSMNLDESEQEFLNQTFLQSYMDASSRRKGLTDEEKKEVNKEIRKELKAELGKKFSKDEIKEILALIKEKRLKDKENK